MEVAGSTDGIAMTIHLHHLIIATSDRDRTADYLEQLLELSEPWDNGIFRSFQLDDGVVINIAAPPGVEVQPQHYAFLVTEAHFDRIRARFDRDQVAYTADPFGQHPGEIGAANRDGGGRRLYFHGPDQHMLEIITARYEDVPARSRRGPRA